MATGTTCQYLRTKHRVSAQWAGTSLCPLHWSPCDLGKITSLLERQYPTLETPAHVLAQMNWGKCLNIWASREGREDAGMKWEWFTRKTGKLPTLYHVLGTVSGMARYLLTESFSALRLDVGQIIPIWRMRKDTVRLRNVQSVAHQERQSPELHSNALCPSWAPPAPHPCLATGAARSTTAPSREIQASTCYVPGSIFLAITLWGWCY